MAENLTNPSPSIFKLASFDTYTKDAGITQNTWYTALTVSKRGRVHSINIFQDNTEAGAKNMELRVTLDGRVMTATGSLNSGATTKWTLSETADSGTFSTSAYLAGLYQALEYTTMTIEIRTTSAPGTNQRFIVYTNYMDLV